MPAIEAGDDIPAIRVFLKGTELDLREYFSNHTGVLFCVPGAFTSECTKKHLPGFRDAAEIIKAHVDFLGCVAVNDPAVIKAWAQYTDSTKQITFISDFNGSLTRAFGLEQDFTEYGLGFRCRRSAMILRAGKVCWVGFDTSAYVGSVLEALKIKLTSDEPAQTQFEPQTQRDVFVRKGPNLFIVSQNESGLELIGKTFDGGLDNLTAPIEGAKFIFPPEVMSHQIRANRCRDLARFCSIIQSISTCIPVIMVTFTDIIDDLLPHLLPVLHLHRVRLEDCSLYLKNDVEDSSASSDSKLLTQRLDTAVPIALTRIFVEDKELFNILLECRAPWNVSFVRHQI